MTTTDHHEGLAFVRFMMVVGSVSPLFILWAIRGTSLVSDWYFIAFCAVMVIVPNGFLLIRIVVAKRDNERRELVVGNTEDNRGHLLVYLFTMLLPLYAEALATWRELAATLAALGFIAFVFWYMNLYYMNLLLVLLGYRVFTLHPDSTSGPLAGQLSYVLITRRPALAKGEHIPSYRISNTVYLEVS